MNIKTQWTTQPRTKEKGKNPTKNKAAHLRNPLETVKYLKISEGYDRVRLYCNL